MEYIRDILPTIISAVIGYAVWAIKKSQLKSERELARQMREAENARKEDEAWRQAISANTVALSRYHLMKIYRYAMQVGYIYPDQLAVFEALYQTYHDLGGNGIITSYREHLMELPSQPEAPSTGDWRGL